MAQPHSVHTLQGTLETERLKAVEAMAVGEGVATPAAVQELATIQSALVAVREVIEAHGGRLGWGSPAPLI
jgi:hypothetical protein